MPPENTSQRKLAAILFADVVGYTALMQRDEAAAAAQLRKFQSSIEFQVADYQGKVVNFYGDGALCIFNNPLEAMRCGIALQSGFQSDPAVPVRIGIHSGTVIQEGDKVFGDSVNVAARIESMGIPGAILVSKKIRDELKNQPDILLSSLGTFEFKNVEEPMEVFALANEGFAVPKKDQITGKFKAQPKTSSSSLLKYLIPLAAIVVIGLGVWMWGSGSNGSMSLGGSSGLEPTNTPLSKADRNKRVAVMIFENKTGSEELEDFGTMISDWVTKGLMETEEADVISASNIQSIVATASMGPTELKQFSKSSGVGIVLKGNYYLQEEDIIIHAEVVDTETGEILHALDRIQGPRSKMIDLLDQLTDEILGYWSIKSSNRFLQNPPKYEAYQKYVLANNLFGDRHHIDRVEQLLTEAITIDPDFHEATIKLAVHNGNGNRNIVKYDSLLNVLSTKTESMSKWENLRYQQVRASSNREWEKGGEICEKMYAMDPSDASANYNAGNFFVRANMPKRAIDILTKLDYKYRIMDIEEWSWYEPRLGEAYFMNGDYTEAIAVAENNPFAKMIDGLADMHIRSLIRLDSIHLLENVIDRYKERGIYRGNGRKLDNGSLYQYVCQEAYQLDNKELLDEYLNKLKHWNNDNKDNRNFNHFNGLIYYFRNDFIAAKEYFEKDIDGFGTGGYLQALSRMGSCDGRNGQKEAALGYKSIIIEWEEKEGHKVANKGILGLSYYCLARIDANLGNTEEALNNLKIAKNKGAWFYPNFWSYDSFLKPLFDNKEFQDLVNPRD